MSTTRAITDDGNAWVTTFFGGVQRGRCFDIGLARDGQKVKATLTEEELWNFLKAINDPTPDDGLRPEMI